MSSRFAFGFLLGAMLAVGGGVATAALAREGGLSLPRLPSSSRDVGPVTVVLDRDGGRVFAGIDDPKRGLSGILLRQGIGYVDVPAFQGTDAQWRRFVTCVESKFDGFAVSVTERAPSDGRYMLARVGGTPDQFGFADSVGGISPHKGSVIDDAVLFVFQPEGRTIDVMCETAAHEIGHAIGLDHSRLCSDIMSYEYCGPREFREEAARCGEWEDRDCDGGASTQSSAQSLAALVGRRPETRPRASAPAPKVARTSGPKMTVRATATPRADEPYAVEVEVADPRAVRAVDLYWYGQRGVRLRCGESSRAVPFHCARDGDTFRFVVDGGAGRRKWFVRVTNTDGRVVRTEAKSIDLR